MAVDTDIDKIDQVIALPSRNTKTRGLQIANRYKKKDLKNTCSMNIREKQNQLCTHHNTKTPVLGKSPATYEHNS